MMFLSPIRQNLFFAKRIERRAFMRIYIYREEEEEEEVKRLRRRPLSMIMRTSMSSLLCLSLFLSLSQKSAFETLSQGGGT